MKENLSVTPTACHCPGCGSQHVLRPLVRASHPAGRGPNSDSLFLPLAAVVVVAPNEGRLWQNGKLHLFAPPLGELSPKVTERVIEDIQGKKTRNYAEFYFYLPQLPDELLAVLP